MASKFVYDYYEVEIPGDVFDGEDSLEQLASLAIDEAREKTKLYCTPCVWTSEKVSGEVGSSGDVTFRVRRKRLRRSK